MDVILITGQSGAGKTSVIEALEDRGVYCVDNVPPLLIPAFVGITSKADNIKHLAVVTDARAGEMFSGFIDCINSLKESGIKYKVLFLQCSSDVLERRYRETRRRHPIQADGAYSVKDAIEQEKNMLSNAYSMSDYHIDTSFLSVRQLKESINSLFDDINSDSMTVKVVSFGFKYGVPTEADLLFDARCIPNPFYIEKLKPLSGCDIEIKEWLNTFEDTHRFMGKIMEYLDFSLPLYKKEGKSQLVIGVGCTGGRHRSVCCAEALGDYINKLGFDCTVHHRDKEKNYS